MEDSNPIGRLRVEVATPFHSPVFLLSRLEFPPFFSTFNEIGIAQSLKCFLHYVNGHGFVNRLQHHRSNIPGSSWDFTHELEETDCLCHPKRPTAVIRECLGNLSDIGSTLLETPFDKFVDVIQSDERPNRFGSEVCSF